MLLGEPHRESPFPPVRHQAIPGNDGESLYLVALPWLSCQGGLVPPSLPPVPWHCMKGGGAAERRSPSPGTGSSAEHFALLKAIALARAKLQRGPQLGHAPQIGTRPGATTGSSSQVRVGPFLLPASLLLLGGAPGHGMRSLTPLAGPDYFIFFIFCSGKLWSG